MPVEIWLLLEGTISRTRIAMPVGESPGWPEKLTFARSNYPLKAIE
jgi:hypothetical protein